MDSLPTSRVTMSRPCSRTVVWRSRRIKRGLRRNARNHKAYIVIFMCFATKAVHIELVSDLTAEFYQRASMIYFS